MRLGIVVPGGFDPDADAASIPALRAVVQELGRRHQVRVFASAGRHPGTYRVGEIDVTQLGPRAAPGPGSALQLARAFGRWISAAGPFDLLHAFWADRAALLATLAARALSIPSVVSLGGGELAWLPDIPYGGAGSVRGRAVTRAALRLAGAVTAGTTFVARLLPPALAGRAAIVPLGVDLTRFDAASARAAGPPWRLVHVANLNEVKDQPTLLRAFRRVVDRLGDVRLDCAGQDALSGQIQAAAVELGLGDRVTFHGFLPQRQVAELYRRAHLNVLSSRHESQGVVILEAAAAGVPTVGTQVGLLDTLSPSAARAVPVRDATALADAITALLTDQASRDALGVAAQDFARAHDVVWTARAFDEIYGRL